MLSAIPLVVAGLMGAAGVALWAAAAHAKPGAGLENAAQMLLFHAVAVLAATPLLDTGRLWRATGLFAVGGWLIGSLLFAGDIALRAFTGQRLFPMAAPVGGTILIFAWLVLAASARSFGKS